MNRMRVIFPIPTSLEHVEMMMIKSTITFFHGDKKAAAKALGVSLKTIYNKLEKERPRFKSTVQSPPKEHV